MKFALREVRTSDTVTFAVEGNNSFHKLELSKTLLRFAEFDFTYFWEQCIEAGRNARKTGRISQNLVNMAINALIKCHPYVEACISSDFSSVVLDCIIAYICHSEGIGLEELWSRCISPKSLYEKSIFNRVSEYKTGRGINQWINIVRMQEYARSKMQFIYETDDNIMLRGRDYKARKEYFDLAFSVAANETGCPMDQMPSVRKYTPAQLPDSVFMMGRISKNIYRRLSEVLGSAEMCNQRHINNRNRDQTALDAFSYVKDMPRPEENDMNFAVEAVSSMPSEVYVPNSFKAIIDLEFTCMSEERIYLSKCPRCGKYFARALDEKSPYCRRVNSSGRTCSELMDDALEIAAMRSGEPVKLKKQTDLQLTFDSISVGQPEETAEAAAEPEKEEPVSENALREEPSEPLREIPKELEKRCQKVYNLLYKRIGRLMTEGEFREWSKYMSDVKRDFREGNADTEQMEYFLNYWETAVKKQSSKSKKHKDRAENADNAIAVSAAEERDDENEEQTADGTEDIPPDAFFNEAMTIAEEKDTSGISPAGTEATPEERAYKPFTPPKYNTVLEAMLDGKYKSEELLSETGGAAAEDLAEIKVKGKKVTLPNWERITRE